MVAETITTHIDQRQLPDKTVSLEESSHSPAANRARSFLRLALRIRASRTAGEMHLVGDMTTVIPLITRASAIGGTKTMLVVMTAREVGFAVLSAKLPLTNARSYKPVAALVLSVHSA